MSAVQSNKQFKENISADDHGNPLSTLELETLDRKAIISAAGSYTIQAASILFGFITKIVLARLLLPQAWGLFAEAIIVLSFFEMTRDFGISQHLIRQERPAYGNALILEVSLAISFLLLMQFIAPWFSFLSPQVPAILRVIFVAGVIKAFSAIPESYVYRELLVKKIVPVSLASLLVNASVGIILAWQGFGVWSLVFGLIASTLVSTVANWLLFYKHLRLEFTLAHSLALLSGGKNLFLIGAIGLLSSRIDIALAGSLLTPKMTGYYFMALSLILWPARVLESALHETLFPVFAKLKDNTEKLARVYGLATRLILSIEAPIYFFIFFTAGTILPMLLGPQWAPIVPLVRILAFLAIVDPITMFGLEVLRSTGQDRILMLSSIVTFVALALGGWLLTVKYGIQGLAFSRFLSVGSVLVMAAVARTIKGSIHVLVKDIFLMYATIFFALGSVNYFLVESRFVSLTLSVILTGALMIFFHLLFFRNKIGTTKRILFARSATELVTEGE